MSRQTKFRLGPASIEEENEDLKWQRLEREEESDSDLDRFVDGFGYSNADSEEEEERQMFWADQRQQWLALQRKWQHEQVVRASEEPHKRGVVSLLLACCSARQTSFGHLFPRDCADLILRFLTPTEIHRVYELVMSSLFKGYSITGRSKIRYCILGDKPYVQFVLQAMASKYGSYQQAVPAFQQMREGYQHMLWKRHKPLLMKYLKIPDKHKTKFNAASSIEEFQAAVDRVKRFKKQSSRPGTYKGKTCGSFGVLVECIWNLMEERGLYYKEDEYGEVIGEAPWRYVVRRMVNREDPIDEEARSLYARDLQAIFEELTGIPWSHNPGYR
jgi:hypothetical protein